MCSVGLIPACLGEIDAKSGAIRSGGSTHERLTCIVGTPIAAAHPGKVVRAAVRSAWRRSRPAIGSGQPVRILALSNQMKIGQKVHGNIATQRQIAVAAMAADSRDVDHALVDDHVVDLIRIGRRIGAGDRNIDRRIDRDADIGDAARKWPLPPLPAPLAPVAIASEPLPRPVGTLPLPVICGAVPPLPDPEACPDIDRSPPLAVLPFPPLPPTPAIWMAD